VQSFIESSKIEPWVIVQVSVFWWIVTEKNEIDS